MASAAFLIEMARQQDAHPKTKIEFITVGGAVTDISAYYDSGANFQQQKDRAPDEIQAADFDIVLANHDNKFSEYDPTSLLYGIQYHGARIRVSEGFVLPDGTEEYQVKCVGFIDQIIADGSISRVTFRCRDLIRQLLDRALNPSPASELAVAAIGNIGNGLCSVVAVLPFKTKNELWTLTCTTAGASGVAQFSVIGGTSGNVGTLTVGTQFTTGSNAGGIKFNITAGSANFAIGDVFKFTTAQFPEFTSMNVVKIIWNVLTGYDWDSNTQSAWSGQVFAFDHTQSTANTDLDYTAFSNAITQINSSGGYSLTGYCPRDVSAVDFVRNLMLMFLGSIFTGQDGRLTIKVYTPTFTAASGTLLSDAQKVTILGYTRTIDEVINYAVVSYKATQTWEFSDVTPAYDGTYVYSDATSVAKYNVIAQQYTFNWYATNGQHAINFAQRLIGKFGDPPLTVDFVTGLDAILLQLGDIVAITDTKYILSAVLCEIAIIQAGYDNNPAQIQIRARRDSALSATFGYLGSSANEGDGLSPQSGNYDTASASDKLFAYCGQTGGGGGPDYRMF